ncbi:MAG: S-adenosylmethionine synthetase N-terminal domain-containing protein [Spirochaeta sp.]|nr:S-adenosylmethionine synthetase N-terminal domain-containing protein [Spirochaeta sp.]
MSVGENYYFTSESVSEGHPDKLADQAEQFASMLDSTPLEIGELAWAK